MRRRKVPVSTEAILLALLARGENYGIGLQELAAKLTQNQILLGQGNTYPLLSRLRRDGLICVSRVGDAPDQNGRPRQYYVLTEEGEKLHQAHKHMILGIYSKI